MSQSDSTKQNANFLGRWARRKAQVKSEMPADNTSGKPTPEELPGAAGQIIHSVPPGDGTPDEVTPEPIPSLDSLDENSSYARFMASDVEKNLRRLALRKLFKAPVFSIRDGLDDYDDDFTSFEKLGNTVTADMKFHKERLEAAAAKAQQEQENRMLAQSDDTSEQVRQETVANAETENEADAEANIASDPLTTGTQESQPSAGTACEPNLVTLAQPQQRLPETAPPVLAPRRQGLRLRVDAPDDTQDA